MLSRRLVWVLLAISLIANGFFLINHGEDDPAIAATTVPAPQTAISTTTRAEWVPTTTKADPFGDMVRHHASRLGITIRMAESMANEVCYSLDTGRSVESEFLAMLDWVYANYGDDFYAGESAGFIFSVGIRVFCPQYAPELINFFGRAAG